MGNNSLPKAFTKTRTNPIGGKTVLTYSQWRMNICRWLTRHWLAASSTRRAQLWKAQDGPKLIRKDAPRRAKRMIELNQMNIRVINQMDIIILIIISH